MAINITCYTKIDVIELQSKLDIVKLKYPRVFSYDYIIYPARIVLDLQHLLQIKDPIERYNMESNIIIANEFGMINPKSYFLIALNEKSYPNIEICEMANLIRQEFSADNVILLQNGDVLI